jgi:transcriptional regulator with XRE-family HTH domain
MTLGRRIREARIATGHDTQEKLGEKLGVSRAAISQWENDVALPEPKRIPALVKELRRSWEYLSTGNEPKPIESEDVGVKKSSTSVNDATGVEKEPTMSPVEQRAFIQELDPLPPEERAAWYERIRAARLKRQQGAEAAAQDPQTGRAS